MNLGFVILYVQDIGKAKVFYTDVVGLKVVEALSGPTFVALQSDGGSRLALQDKTAARVPQKQPEQSGGVEVSFEVDDVDGTWQRWQDKGVELVTAPVDLPFGRFCMAKDPDGFYLSAYHFPQRSN